MTMRTKQRKTPASGGENKLDNRFATLGNEEERNRRNIRLSGKKEGKPSLQKRGADGGDSQGEELKEEVTIM